MNPTLYTISIAGVPIKQFTDLTEATNYQNKINYEYKLRELLHMKVEKTLEDSKFTEANEVLNYIMRK